jgi:bifunctional DNA-binding transcriptional regulator/antitoxin component of YhaV-PrlF toxin-antitoxin module
MQPIDDYTKADLPDDVYFVRRPDRNLGRVVIPEDIARLIGCSVGDVVVLTARHCGTGATVTFMQTFVMADNRVTMPVAARDAIGLTLVEAEEGPGCSGSCSKSEYPGVEFHIRGLYRAPKPNQVRGRPRGVVIHYDESENL